MAKSSVERKAAAAKKAGDVKGGKKIVATNRKARHNYSVLEVFEAGVVLTGTEVKSLRQGSASLEQSWCRCDNGEIWLIDANSSSACTSTPPTLGSAGASHSSTSVAGVIG